MIFIYGLVCPISEEIRYIGKTDNPKRRLRSHISDAARGVYNHHAARWIRKLYNAGMSPKMVILHEVGPEENWQDAERQAIQIAVEAGARLTNSTAGGDGASFFDEEVQKRKSRAMKSIWHQSDYRSAVLAARNDPRFLQEQGERLRQRWTDPAAKEKMMQGRWNEERRREQAARISDPARAAKIARALAAPDLIARRNASIKAAWARRKAAKSEAKDAPRSS